MYYSSNWGIPHCQGWKVQEIYLWASFDAARRFRMSGLEDDYIFPLPLVKLTVSVSCFIIPYDIPPRGMTLRAWITQEKKLKLCNSDVTEELPMLTNNYTHFFSSVRVFDGAPSTYFIRWHINRSWDMAKCIFPSTEFTNPCLKRGRIIQRQGWKLLYRLLNHCLTPTSGILQLRKPNSVSDFPANICSDSWLLSNSHYPYHSVTNRDL